MKNRIFNKFAHTHKHQTSKETNELLKEKKEFKGKRSGTKIWSNSQTDKEFWFKITHQISIRIHARLTDLKPFQLFIFFLLKKELISAAIDSKYDYIILFNPFQ